MGLCPNCKTQEISLEDRLMHRKVDEVQVCGDCYFDELGAIVERHPIVNPVIVRSASTEES